MAEPKDRPVKWRWARNGALIGLIIVLADMFLEWRGPRYYPWSDAEMIANNIGQMVAVIGFLALIGLGFGAIRDRRRRPQSN
jgi:hypothetical protein